MAIKKTLCITSIIIIMLMTLGLSSNTFAQDKNLVVRIAKLQIDSTQLEAYKAALKLQAETAVRLESGVLNLYAVYEKDKPTQVTVFEIYANEDVYRTHLKAPHFIQYKTSTREMVKSLELIETVPIVLETKYKNSN